MISMLVEVSELKQDKTSPLMSLANFSKDSEVRAIKKEKNVKVFSKKMKLHGVKIFSDGAISNFQQRIKS